MSWQRVEEVLQIKNISIKSLSIKSGLNYETLRNYRYKHYEPTFKTMCKIADALGVNLDELRGDKDEVNTRR